MIPELRWLVLFGHFGKYVRELLPVMNYEGSSRLMLSLFDLTTCEGDLLAHDLELVLVDEVVNVVIIFLILLYPLVRQ